MIPEPEPTERQHPPRPQAPSSEVGLEIGLVLRRPPRLLGIDPFYAEFIAGMERVLAADDGSVLLQVVPSLTKETETYRRWAASGQVAGVVLADLVDDDGRADFLRTLGIPALVLGEKTPPPGVAAVQVDNYAAMTDAVTRLTDLGHRRIGRVSGPRPLLHTRARTEAFEVATADLGAEGVVVEGDYTEESGGRATRTLLGLAEPPTAIIYDNDLMAVAGLGVAAELGIDVPGSLSLLAWDDSALCQLATPPLSVMSRDVRALGEMAAGALLGLIRNDVPAILPAPSPRFITRGSTGTAPPDPR
ncbi:DNA-binding LacI/PurR family transcriptional regulator [Cryobacterium sp. MP_M3]|uniref:LacI family DNA-binding transcriptional regulator n=1 Tax=unclassified Cryobacterium TaxID=2649013 RepID=UPI001A18FC7E|nr:MULTISPECIES: substrate-binding domain-containing protein [unclassified Cryobacterium]MBG6059447.1 DNA-binding LacI/PurR family transcriptional regulator [Cryobacterium sp. MP_M3]